MTLQVGALRTWLTAWTPDPTTPDVEAALQIANRTRICTFLDANPDALSRECRAGHITASAFVVDLWGQRFAAVRHGLAGRWLQPGGHLESEDLDVLAAARREAEEETGMFVVIDPRPLRLDIHEVQCRTSDGSKGPSVHFDIELLGVTGPGAVTRAASDPVAWWPLDAPDPGDRALAALRHAARRRIRPEEVIHRP